MKLRNVLLWTALSSLNVASLAEPANAQTASVKQSPLTRVRAQLRHYDLTPPGTLALLSELGRYAAQLQGPEATEAAFLRAAAASDVLFIADHTGDAALRTRLAEQLGFTPEALVPSLVRELQACATGFYRAPALQVLAELMRPPGTGAPPTQPSDTRQDAQFVRIAAQLLTSDPGAGGKVAQLAQDPCKTPDACPASFATLSPQGRRALLYLVQLEAAGARLEKARKFGDPLAAALGPTLERELAQIYGSSLRLPPALPNDLELELPGGGGAWPAPDLIVFVRAREVRYAHVPRTIFGADHDLRFGPEPGPIYPATATIANTSEPGPPTRSLDGLVAALGRARDDTASPLVALIADPDAPVQLVARALVSLRKAGIAHTLLAALTREGALLGVPLRVVLPGVDGPGSVPDLKLRVRLGGYSLDVGRGMIHIPRVRDATGFRFDVAALRSAAATRAPRTAAVSFMGDVSTEQLMVAMFQVAPSRAPVDLVIQ